MQRTPFRYWMENDEILGVITSQDIVEVVDDEMGDDYAKLAGLTAERRFTGNAGREYEETSGHG